MNKQECAKVLAKIQLVDNRQVDALTLDEWFDTIGSLRFEDAVAGVTIHRQESSEWIQPVHVIRNARRAKSIREQEVRAAKAYGLIEADWPASDVLSDAVKEGLADARERARKFAFTSTGERYEIG